MTTIPINAYDTAALLRYWHNSKLRRRGVLNFTNKRLSVQQHYKADLTQDTPLLAKRTQRFSCSVRKRLKMNTCSCKTKAMLIAVQVSNFAYWRIADGIIHIHTTLHDKSKNIIYTFYSVKKKNLKYFMLCHYQSKTVICSMFVIRQKYNLSMAGHEIERSKIKSINYI